jgi:hypothetical protein
MSLNRKLVEFRKKIKANHKKVIDSIIEDHSVNICVFCGEIDNLTREHVIPQWVYDRCLSTGQKFNGVNNTTDKMGQR